jgi:hypothetical protein
VAVGHEHRGRGDGGVDGLDASRVVDVLEAVHDAVGICDRAEQLTGRRGETGQPGGERQHPDRGQVDRRGPGEIETVGGGLRCRLLVRQHVVAGCVGIGDSQGAEHPRDGALVTGFVGEGHGVPVIGRLGVGHQDAVGEPVAEPSGGLLVAVGAIGLERAVDVDDVVGVAGGVGGAVLR